MYTALHVRNEPDVTFNTQVIPTDPGDTSLAVLTLRVGALMFDLYLTCEQMADLRASIPVNCERLIKAPVDSIGE